MIEYDCYLIQIYFKVFHQIFYKKIFFFFLINLVDISIDTIKKI